MKIFIQSLQVMGIGMVVIFVVMAVFYGLIELLQKMFPPRNEA